MRLAEIYDIFTSGITEHTGRLIIDESGPGFGTVTGRIGGVKPGYPELAWMREGPGEIARAIAKRKGVTYDRILQSVRQWAEREGYKPKRKRAAAVPTVPAHTGRASCAHCEELHTTGQHRFHGKGAFHRTHLFSFPTRRNPQMMTAAQAKEVYEFFNRYGMVKPLTPAMLAKARAKLRQTRKRPANPRGRWQVWSRAKLAGGPFRFEGSMNKTQAVYWGRVHAQRRDAMVLTPTGEAYTLNGARITTERLQGWIDRTKGRPAERRSNPRTRAERDGMSRNLGTADALYYTRKIGAHPGYYKHDYESEPEVIALPDGDVLLHQRGRK